MNDKRIMLNDEVRREGLFKRLITKIKKDPAVPIGMAGWTGLVGYGLYTVKNRKVSLPVYLIHLRVKAQAFAVGCMTLAVVYNIYKFKTKDTSSSIENTQNSAN